MQRDPRMCVIGAVAVALAGCLGNLDPQPGPGPNVIGTWSGSTAGVTVSMVLDSSTCEFGCAGATTGGTYSDNSVNVHGTFTGGGYSLTPPGQALYSSPLPGWTISITPVDTLHTAVGVTFNGTFSTATAASGYIKITNGAASDSVAITLSKQ